MLTDKTRRYGSSYGVRTRNSPSSMTTATAVSTHGIKNVYQVALMTMLGQELYLTRRMPTLDQIEVKKPSLLS